MRKFIFCNMFRPFISVIRYKHVQDKRIHRFVSVVFGPITKTDVDSLAQRNDDTKNCNKIKLYPQLSSGGARTKWLNGVQNCPVVARME